MSEKESLDLVSTNFFDGLELRFGFDAFDDHLHAEFLSKQDERAHHGFCLGTLHYLFHKTAVDFQSIKRQFLDIGDRRSSFVACLPPAAKTPDRRAQIHAAAHLLPMQPAGFSAGAPELE